MMCRCSTHAHWEVRVNDAGKPPDRGRDRRDVPPGGAFGDALRDARTARNLNQSELAERVMMDRSIISRLETGDRVVTPEQARTLAEILDAPNLLELATSTGKKNAKYRPPAKREE